MNLLNDLRRAIAEQPAIQQILTAIETNPALRIAPLIHTARSVVVAALADRRPQPLLYLTANNDAALRAAEDLRQWLPAARVLYFPAGDALPYEQMSPGDDFVGKRLRVLHTLHSDPLPQQPLVIVASIKAVIQPTLNRDELQQATIKLSRSQEYSQDRLLRRLIDMGYRPAPSVEAPGEFNRRGGIIDVWPGADDQPLRIDFFGDEIDSLRRFNPATQRSEQRLETISLGPPYETPLWNRETALERIRAIDPAALRPEAAAEWEAAIERLELNQRFDGRSFYAPFFRTRMDLTPGADQPALPAHLPSGAIICYSEAQFLAQQVADLHAQADEQRRRLIDAGELPPAFPRPYLLWDELFSNGVRPGLTMLDLSNNEGTVGPLSRAPQIAPPDFTPVDTFAGQFRRLIGDIVERTQDHQRTLAVTAQAARLQELVHERIERDEALPTGTSEHFQVVHNTLEGGWRLPALALTLYTDSEIFGIRPRRPLAERRRTNRNADDRASFLRGLKPSDHVVHIEHGIAIFDGMIHRTVGEIEREYLVLRYAAGDKIYVPVDQVDRVTRYIGAGDNAPTLTRLGTQDWERTKRKVRAAVRDLAEELLNLYAKRQLRRGHAFGPDNEWQREIEAAFPYIETDDQIHAITDVKQDMERDQPMDRLICGDVGFGKTEVALRAAFKAVQDGRQVAILVPTTVLAQQHFDTFRRRLEAYPVTVEMLSRFRTNREQQAILQQLGRGRVDIIVGTHRLLSKDVSFKNLGLVIVDEEQRFGVRHKERLKHLRAEVDVLTLTATPIPRTLHMAMAGIRDLSVIDTPPEDRVPIKTYVTPHNDELIREAIMREIERDGQVFFVHNRVQSIYHVANHLRTLVPEASIGVGHGQMEERELERVMLDFFEGRFDVLVCTTIIESGLDIPNANTIVIDNATHFGLAQLYQLRGRVGRSTNRAYAYLLYKPEQRMTEESQQRLEAIQEATELGAGFRVAMRDLEIRGAGNLLGAEQSGHIAAVGFDLYSRLLEQAVKQLKQQVDAGQPILEPEPTTNGATGAATRNRPIINEKVLVSPLVTLDLPLTAYLPNDYISDDTVRLGVYQRMVEAQTPDEVRSLRQELQDRFGTPPQPALHLLTWLQIKALALQAGVTSVISTSDEFVVRLPILEPPMREKLRRRFQRDEDIRIGPQFVRLDRRRLGDDWSAKVTDVLALLAG
jgi:transcription-repair coupling factor (superfamily II helicase)